MMHPPAVRSARTHIAILLGLTLLLAACAPIPPARQAAPPAPTATSPAATEPSFVEPGTAAPLGTAVEALQNGTYELPDFGTVQLKDGKFEEKTGASNVRAAGLGAATTGDLNGDGTQDAVADVWVNSGGTGVFHYLVALLNKDGSLRQAATSLLGDRVRVDRLRIDPQGAVAVDLVGFKAGDPACCPSQPMIRTYQLGGSVLKMLSEGARTPTP